MRHRDSIHRLTAWLARVLPPLAALGLAVLAFLPALRVAGIVATRAAGDSPFLLQRVHQMSAALIAGQFPPRWMPDAAYGLGYPFWNYYSPLAYGLPGAIVVLGGGFVGAIKITGLLCFLAAAGGAYRLGRETWDSRAAGFLASAAYTFAPYHLVNVYVRGDALAELAAYAVFPWVLVALDRAVRRRSAGATAGLALATALLLVSHNISALLFAPVVLAYALWRLWVSPPGSEPPLSRPGLRRSAPPGIPAGEAIADPTRWTGLPVAVLRGMAAAERRLWPWRPRGRAAGAAAVAGGLLLGAGLAAWFVLPAAFLERDAVQLGANTTGYFHYANHFRSLDLVDLAPLFDYAVDDATGAPTRVGLVQLLFALLGLVIGLAASRSSARHDSPRRDTARRGAIAFWAVVALVTTLMITPLSRPLWDFLPLLDFAQFPWRWLSVQALALAMLTGLLVAEHRPWRWPLALGAAAVLALAGMADLRVETLPVDKVTRSDLTTYEVFTGNIGSTVRSEYLPAAVVERPRSGPDAILGHAGSPRVAGGTGTIEAATLIRRQAASQDWQIKLAGGQPATVAFPTYWFPGWTASINGGSPRPTGVIQGSGWLTVDIDPNACGATGQCFVSLSLARSDARAIAEGLSLVAFLVFLALLLVDRRRRWGWILLALVVAVPALALAARSLPVGRSGGPVTLDLARTPYPHANPDGLAYGDARLVEARLEAQNMQGMGVTEGQTPHLEAGEKLTVNLNWLDAPPDLRVKASLVSPAEPGFGVPAILISADQAPDAPEALVLDVPNDAATGLYFIRLDVTADGEPLSATSAEGYDLDTVYLGPVRVRAKPGQITPPPTFVAQMGDVTLHDIQATRRPAGDQGWLEVRMLWQAARPLAQELMTSVRLIDSVGRTVAQEDKLPLYGDFPTTVWPAGEIVADRRWLPLAEDIKAGEDYRVEVVLYNPATGEELGSGRLDDVSVGP